MSRTGHSSPVSGRRTKGGWLALAALLVGAVVAQAPLPATAESPSRITWDSRGDFEANACSTGAPTTRAGVSTSLTPGSVKLAGRNAADEYPVSADSHNTVGVKSDGTVRATGRNDYGQLNVSGWTDIVAVSQGYFHTVGLRSDGTVVGIGDNTGGCVSGLAGWTDIVDVSAGDFSTVGLKSDGTVVTAGGNGWGECNVSGWTDIVDVSSGEDVTIGLKSDGTCLGTGYNWHGQCDVSGWTDIVAVSTDGNHTVGLKSNGTVVATGSNGWGECNVSGWTDIVAVSAGENHTVGVRSDGTCVATGLNDYGQCNVSGWHDIVGISAAREHTVGVKYDGTVVAVGRNDYGQCNVSGWTDMGHDPRTGTIGGAGDAIGLRGDVGSTLGRALRAETAALRRGEAVKFAVRTSSDGASWSAPMGSDGSPIDWTNGTGNYVGRAASDKATRTALPGIPDARYVDIVVRLESAGPSTPELKSVTFGFEDPPVAFPDSASAYLNTTMTVPARRGVLANDTDVDTPHGSLTAELVEGAGHGAVVLSADGSYTYRPNTGWSGIDQFRYRAFDGFFYSDPTTVTVTTVTHDDTPPTVPEPLSYAALTTETVKLSWPASEDDLSGVARYDVYDGGVNVGSTQGTTFVIGGLLPGSEHVFSVRAVDVVGNVSAFAELALTMPEAGDSVPVPVGESVTAALNVEVTGYGNSSDMGTATVTITGVTEPGFLTLVRSETPPHDGPSTFKFVDDYYDVSFTGSFDGTVTVTLPYDERMPDSRAMNLTLQHWVDNGWEKVPTTVDLVNHTITAEVTSLSPLVVVEPATAIATASIVPATPLLTPAYGKATVFVVVLKSTDPHGGAVALPGFVIVLERRAGAAWSAAGTFTAAAGLPGTYKARAVPLASVLTVFRARLTQNALYTAPAVTLTVVPKAKLSAPRSSTGYPRRYRTFYVSGTVSPKRSMSGKLQVFRYARRHWLLVSARTVKVSSGGYRYGIKLRAGRYRFRIYVGANTAAALVARTYSPYSRPVSVW
jgi:alpha-tubulin suppressor-like RCC1 family protein